MCILILSATIIEENNIDSWKILRIEDRLDFFLFIEILEILMDSVTPRPGEVDTWQSPRALEWVPVSQAPSKDSQGLWYHSLITN